MILRRFLHGSTSVTKRGMASTNTPCGGSTLERFLFLSIVLATPVCGGNWPQFRGPAGTGHTEETNLPVTWGGPDQVNVLWTSPLPGEGHASPIVWNDTVYVCTAAWPPETKAREEIMPEHHVTAYAAANGKLLWDTLVEPGPWLRKDLRSGPGGGYAAPTPATDGERVYVAFGSSVLAALDPQGDIVWRKEIVPHTFDVTLGSSPVLHNDSVLLLCAMAIPSDSCVIAFDKSDGTVRWKEKLPGMTFGHSTPLIIQVNGTSQMLVLASGMSVKDDALRSLDPTNGKLLWWCRGAGDAASPAYGSGLVYFDSGRGGPGFTVDPTGAGDVSSSHIRWTIDQVPEGIGSPIMVGQYVYRLHNPGILKCWDASTGKMLYAERLKDLSTTWASPVADANGRLYFANAGKSYVIQSGPEFRILATNDLGDGNHPSPAVSNGRLFLAGSKNLHCVGL